MIQEGDQCLCRGKVCTVRHLATDTAIIDYLGGGDGVVARNELQTLDQASSGLSAPATPYLGKWAERPKGRKPREVKRCPIAGCPYESAALGQHLKRVHGTNTAEATRG